MRFPIKAKLGFAFGTILILLGTTGVIGVDTPPSANTHMQQFAQKPFAQVQLVGQMQADMINTARLLNRGLADGSDAGKASTRKQFEDFRADFNVVIKQYAANALAETREATVGPVRDGWSDYLTEAGKAWDRSQQNTSNKATDMILQSSKPFVKQVAKASSALAETIKGDVNDRQAAALLQQFELDFAKLRLLTSNVDPPPLEVVQPDVWLSSLEDG